MSARILDRPTFHAVLDETRAATADAVRDEAVAARIADQLTWIARRTERGTIPDEVDAAAIDLGPLSVQLEASPDYRRALQELDYGFRRYRALGARFEPLEGVPHRRGIVQVRFGSPAYAKRALDLDAALVIGADDRADLVVKDDLASRHAHVRWTGLSAVVEALTSMPVVLDGRAVRRGELSSGGVLQLGDTTLRFFAEAFSPPREAVDARPGVGAAITALTAPRTEGRLFAVVDAARDRRILQLLEEAVDAHASLYEGEQARSLDEVAPYLVRFDPRSRLLERLLTEGWGQAWGIFLISGSAPKMVRRALRRLLMVSADTRTDALYFRFYDPRAFGRFAPIATVRQRSELLAEAEAIVYEGEDGALHRFEGTA